MLHRERGFYMSKKENMMFELKETCDFLDVFEHCSEAPDSLSSGEYPDAQIGHIRAYWNQDGWQGSYFPCRGELWSKAFHRESQDIYRCLVTQLDNLESLRKFCKVHPSSSVSEYEYDFFMNGHVADYWIRFITRENDYNLYLKGFTKNH